MKEDCQLEEHKGVVQEIISSDEARRRKIMHLRAKSTGRVLLVRCLTTGLVVPVRKKVCRFPGERKKKENIVSVTSNVVPLEPALRNVQQETAPAVMIIK